MMLHNIVTLHNAKLRYVIISRHDVILENHNFEGIKNKEVHGQIMHKMSVARV